jgi:hypothetical protein
MSVLDSIGTLGLGAVGLASGASPLTLLAGANLASGLLGANAATNAANTQADAARAAQDRLQQNYQQLAPQYDPYLQTGSTGLSKLNASIDSLTDPFSATKMMQGFAPGYDFRLQQGQTATNLANNATGGLIGGNALKGLQDYTQNFASNEYNNAFNQNQTQQGNIYNRLVGLAGIGQTGLTNLSNLATGNASNISQLGVGAANAQAAGTVGATNALTGGLTNTANTNYLATLLANKQPVSSPEYGNVVPQGNSGLA